MTTYLLASFFYLRFLSSAAYCKLSTAPKSLNHTELVEGHDGKEHLGAVGIA